MGLDIILNITQFQDIYKSEGGIKELNKYIMLNPYHDSKTTTFRKTIPSGKFLVILGIRTSSDGGAFNCMNGYT